MVGWLVGWSAYPLNPMQENALRWLVKVGKAQEWALLMRHRVTLGHQQQAAILYLWSQTFPESGNLSPVRGRFGRTVPQGAEQDKPGSCLGGGAPTIGPALRMYSEK